MRAGQLSQIGCDWLDVRGQRDIRPIPLPRASVISSVHEPRGLRVMDSQSFAGILAAVVAAVVLIVAFVYGPLGQFGKPAKAPTAQSAPAAPAAPGPRGPVIREVPN